MMETESGFVCTVKETEETDEQIGLGIASKYDTLGMALIHARENIPLCYYQYWIKRELANPLCMLAYACEHPSRGRKRKIKMDVDTMVTQWLDLIKKLAVAHDVDEKDAASSKLDDYLMPIVGAPVAQIREFYKKLTAALKADHSIPWAVWKMFDFYGTNILDKITTEKELELKKGLAAKIAEHSIKEIPLEDWIQSMVGALMWRDEETLAEIDKKLEGGEKPRVRGKESCLFLTVGQSEVML